MHTEANIQQLFTNDFSASSNQFLTLCDTDLKLKNITNFAAKLCGYSSFEKMLGSTVYDINAPAVESAPEFERQFRKALDSQKTLKILDIHTYSTGEIKLYSTIKAPVVNAENEITGVFALSEALPEKRILTLATNLIGDLSRYEQLKKSISFSVELIDRFDQLGLSRRESECLYFIIRGHSNKVIAERLTLSPRTIDGYIENIKSKLVCAKRSDIIEYAIVLQLTRFLPISLI